MLPEGVWLVVVGADGDMWRLAMIRRWAGGVCVQVVVVWTHRALYGPLGQAKAAASMRPMRVECEDGVPRLPAGWAVAPSLRLLLLACWVVGIRAARRCCCCCCCCL